MTLMIVTLYIHIYLYIHTYTYTYIYRERDIERHNMHRVGGTRTFLFASTPVSTCLAHLSVMLASSCRCARV